MIMVHSIFRTLRRSRVSFVNVTTIGLLIAILLVPLVLVNPALAPPATVLTPKWTRSGLGTNWEGGLVLGDVTGDGQEDVVFAGGSSDTIYVLNGQNGNTIATYTNTRIGTYCQPQLYDVDGDGILDILVVLFTPPGIAAVKYNKGSSTLTQLWSVTTESGHSTLGSVMAKPVAADIDHDGHLDIFVASQDVSPGDNSTGVYRKNGYDGTISRINYLGQIVAQTFTWRPCSGGLSLADTDNDGVFELYQGDRNALSDSSRSGYADGGYGKGTRSLWADNLTERWNRDDFLSSSQSPVLADVNNDGILDVISGMYREMNVLNSTNGAMIKRWNDNTLSVHYGFTVYDIDGDGHLELLCSDGDHDSDPYVDVYDLVTGTLKTELSLAGGDWKWSPLIADISPTNPGMEIIACPNGTSLTGGYTYYWRGAIMVYGSDYKSIQNVTRDSTNAYLSAQLGYPFVQDIDGDGLFELVTDSSAGKVYAFDTPAPAPGYSSQLPGTHRVRSEVTYYGERRLGVAEPTIVPWGTDYWTTPLVSFVSPGDNALKVPQSTTQLSFKLRDHQSLPLTYTVSTSPDIGSTSGSSTGNSYNWGTYVLTFNKALAYDTTYKWTVSASDGTHVTRRTYSFRTGLAPEVGNHVPTQGTPTVVSQDGLDTTTSTFVCSNQTTADQDGDEVTNVYRWLVNGVSVANLLLPFDTQNETMTKDYSGFGNNGIVKGAAWTENGIVGGAYSFDGRDDAIIVSDGGAGYFNNKTYSTYNPELGGDGTWQEITVEAWVYLTAYNNGSRIVAKLPSYELGFASGYTNRLIASVWPNMGKIAPITTSDSNQAITNQIQSVTYTVPNLQLNTWYHIAFTYEMGVGLKLYLNGALVAQNTNVDKGPIQSSKGEPIYIGRLVQPFAGMIDDVRIYRYAQPAEQIFSRYQESKDGSSSSSLFYPLGIAVPGNTLTCQVIPTDSYGEGSAKTSASKVLLDSPPIASNLQIYPVRDRNLRLDNEDLAASYAYYDADGNPESGTQIRWYRNSLLQPSFNDQKVVPAANTFLGDEWHFTVSPHDSLGSYGKVVTSYSVTIRENAPPSTGTPQLISSAGTNRDDEDLIASAQGSTDTDGDSVTNIYHWTHNGNSVTNLLMPFDTENPALTPGSNSTTNDYSGYGNNGIVVGAQWIKDGVVGGALNFTGNNYVRVKQTGTSLSGDGSWSAITVEFWIKATGTTSTERLIFEHNANYSTSSSSPFGIGYRVDFRARNTGDQITWYVYRSNGYNSTTFTIPGSGWLDWHHVVCTYKAGVGQTIYVDGLQRASIIVTGNINATLDGLLDIGGYSASATDLSRIMDEVRIYPTALSPAQVFQRYIETKDGGTSSSTIVAQETASGDNWACQVIPNDSWIDGTAKNSPTLHVNPAPANGRPRIDWYSPADTTVAVDEGSNIAFSQVSSDPNGDPLSYAWKLDSNVQATTQNWTFSPDYSAGGLHTITLTVSDGHGGSDSQEWDVTVNEAGGLQHTLTVSIVGSGSVTKNPDQTTYADGTVVTITATPNPGWSFGAWGGDASGSVSPTTVTMTGDKAVIATFTQNEYTLTVATVGQGSVAKNPDYVTYTYGSVVTLTAIPNSGWNFAGWSDDASGSDLTTMVTITGDRVVTATFTDQYVLTVNVVGHGLVAKSPNQITYAYNTVVTLTATPDIGWSFAAWSGDASGSVSTTTVTMNGNKIVTATFTPNQYTVTANVVGSGSVTRNPNQATYTYGTVVTLTASPVSGWSFAGWTGDASGSTNPTSITVTGDMAVTATFTHDQYSLTVTVVGGGSVTKNPDQATYTYGAIVALTAQPTSGWSFAGWSGDASGTSLMTSVTMTSNKAVTATFTSVASMFSDGFESGSFSGWSGTTVTTGETTAVVTNPVYAGSYSGRFTSDGGGSYERAYAFRSITSSNELYARGYFYVSQSGIADNSDRFFFIMLLSSGTNIAYAGWRQTNGVVKWNLMIRSGTDYVTAYSAASPSLNTWYSMEVHWKRDSVNGFGELYVNGVLVVSITNTNTASYSGVTTVRMGLPEIYGCASTAVYVDNCVVASTYIGPNLSLSQQTFQTIETGVAQIPETQALPSRKHWMQV